MKWLYLTLVFFTPFITAKGQNKKSFNRAKNNVIITDLRSLDRSPEFPGGDEAFYKFLSKNLRWPVRGDIDIEGRVVISFIVEKDGSLTNFKVEKKLWPDMDAEALRVLKKSPKWIPGKQHGKLVRVKYMVPINFTLSDSSE
ncbi:energy transducer TonB [Mucilaginibacter gotjawali]|uniref:Protein TonB n=2 Tax=Mucilaginibacter gotjawali TaxID=1550579 RepID=A0A839SES5_9SPHI|nr:energy transducer TonB [Mucilaginibacter gotjawali]MBB3055793.1 protein TonB [Mucilaginibacter gotjawali]BAU54614.1 Gram-negative bacterial tonB protein [Mucilaginibacter gotjawali]